MANPEGLQAKIEAVIRDFSFWNYGMDDVDPNSEYAEWVPDLAKEIGAAISEEDETHG